MLAIVFALGLTSQSVLPAPTRTAPIVNAVAPVFRLPLLGGSSVDLSRLHGRVVVVNFFATWCPPCRAETPDLNSAEKRYGRNGVAFLGVDDRENPALVEAFVRRKDIRYPVALDADGAISKRYDVRAIPTTYVIDRLGVVRYRQVDQLDRATLSAALDAALTGRAVPQSEAARRFESTAVTAARQVRAIAATAASALAARNAGVAQTDADDAIKIATAAGRRLDSLQAGPEAASIDYFKSTHERDALNAALADVYDVRAHAGSRNQSGDAEQAALLRGQIAQDRERFAEAERWYLRAVALAPRDVAGYDGEYLAAYEMHDDAKAAAVAHARAEVAPSDPESWLTAASAAMATHRYDDALEQARRALALATSAYSKDASKAGPAYELGRVWLKIARIELAAGNPAAAKPLLRDAATTAPDTIVAQQAQEQFSALTAAPIPIVISGARTAKSTSASPAALFITVRNPSVSARQVRLLSGGLPAHWMLSFCYGTVCNPYKSTVTLASGASRRIELQVVPLDGAGGKWTMTLHSTGTSRLTVGIRAKALKADVSVSAS